MTKIELITRGEIVMARLNEELLASITDYINQNGATVVEAYDDEVVDRNGNNVFDATTFLVEYPGRSIPKGLKKGMGLKKSPKEKNTYYVYKCK